MADVTLPSPTEIPHLVAAHIVAGSSRGTPISTQELAGLIGEVTLQTQILGASMLHVTVIDPELSFLTSGMLDVDADGLLDVIEVNFPDGSDSWWRLCAVDVQWSGQLTQPNITLTFEDRIVAELRDKWGALTSGPSTRTRAQFVKRLVSEVGHRDGLKPITFVCPSLNVVQPFAGKGSSSSSSGPAVTTASGSGGSTVATPTAASLKQSKARGIGAGAKLTVKGAPASASQIAVANTLLGVANSLNAGPVATTAMIFAGIWESGLDPNNGNPNYYGVLAGSVHSFAQGDTVGMANAFLKGDSSKGYQGGGAIAMSRSVSNPVEIAVRVEVPSIWPDNAYGHESGYPGDAAATAEAAAYVAAGGGVTLGTQGVGGTATVAAPISDVAQLTRGVSGNPDESSWDAIQRLATEVGWFAFSDANTLYYMDGDDLAAQKPALYLRLENLAGPRWVSIDTNTGAHSLDTVANLNGTFDNTAFIYRSSHKVKGHIQRKSRIAKPQTPSSIQLNLVCEYDEFRAGELVVIQSAGPLNGRWVVGDATRNVLGDTFTQLTLTPPTEPLPEPQGQQAATAAQVAGVAGAGVGGAGGNLSGTLRDKVVQVARAAIARQASSHAFQYAEVRPYPSSLNAPAPVITDCSGFSILCYKDAGAPDPNGTNFNGSGFTGSLVGMGHSVSTPQPGDLIFYNTIGTNSHVAVYLGNNRIANMGGPNEPIEEDMHIAPIFAIRSYLPFGGKSGISVPSGSPAGATGSSGTGPLRGGFF